MPSLDQIPSIATRTGVSVFALAVDGSRDYPFNNTNFVPPAYVSDAQEILSAADIEKSVNNFFAVKLLRGFREQAAGVLFANVFGTLIDLFFGGGTYHDPDFGIDFPDVEYPCSRSPYVRAASKLYLDYFLTVNNDPQSIPMPTYHVDSASGVRMFIAHMCLVACSRWQNLEGYATDRVTRIGTKEKVLKAMRSNNWITAQRLVWSGSWTKNLADELLGLYIKLIYISTDMSVADQPLPDGSVAFDGTHVVDLYNAVWDVCLNVTGEDPATYMLPYDSPVLEDAVYQAALKTFSNKFVDLWDDILKTEPFMPRILDPRDPGLIHLFISSDAFDESVALFDHPPRLAAYTSKGRSSSYVPTILSKTI